MTSEAAAPRARTTGILPSQALRRVIAEGAVAADGGVPDEIIQPSSLDLRLGPRAWRVRTSFLPGKGVPVADKLQRLTMHEIDLTKPAVLERGCVYMVELQERLDLPRDMWAKANPKSSTGRLDVFTRLVTDGCESFETVEAGYRGPLYLEIAPRTFSVKVRAGQRLNQLRIWRGRPGTSDSLHRELNERAPLVDPASLEGDQPTFRDGLWVSVDLSGEAHGGLIGYRARRHAPLIDLDLIDHYPVEDFWEPIHANAERTLILDPNQFYILVSRERIAVPPDSAAEMVAYDTSFGEFRIHYAGFFDPGFGYDEGGKGGTPAVLEVRSHEVPFEIAHGQRVCRLVYERLLEPPETLYGAGIGSHYQGQGLKLAKHFIQG
ncbi:2'-deoxycytidine 5'-triphosphate deaminase [Minwuia thermotolerans]|uniref:2'-deoxycytidine 5'-triphosphate deaminase n=1 Tax=Minwuia thermotolerans TaxID=2056226 RepID=A0A2M9G4L1_9PROT|nr:2'-deoxycytidine 5'-triphosphate deaminase [Minwuia thermotolerans]PJK30655.1 2'-deoxycytidine 5'-triphosphate deaminase [Minwuia thermotolerans]